MHWQTSSVLYTLKINYKNSVVWCTFKISRFFIFLQLVWKCKPNKTQHPLPLYSLDVIFALWRWCSGSKFHHTSNRWRDRRFQRKCSCDYSWYDSVCGMHTCSLPTTGNSASEIAIFSYSSALLISLLSATPNVSWFLLVFLPCPTRSIFPCAPLHPCPDCQSIALNMSGYCSGQRNSLLEVINVLYWC